MARADPDVESARAELYRVPRDEFTAARNELAKRLRDEGDRATADAVKALRKPSAAAWVVNQLAHGAKADMKRLFAAGDRMRAAEDARAMRQGAEAEREVIVKLLTRAEELADGLSAATAERVRETLHTAAADPEVRAQVEQGGLEREQQLVGFGGGALAPATGGKRPARGRAAKAEADRSDDRRRQREHEAAQRDLERAERAQTRALEHAREAQAELERAQAELEAARDRAAGR